MRRGLVVVGLLVAALPLQADERRSGFLDMSPATQAMQRDDSLNPGMLWVLQGAQAWSRPAAPGGASCASAASAAASAAGTGSAPSPAPAAMQARCVLSRSPMPPAVAGVSRWTSNGSTPAPRSTCGSS